MRRAEHSFRLEHRSNHHDILVIHARAPSKSIEPKLSDEERIEETIARAPAAAHAMLKVRIESDVLTGTKLGNTLEYTELTA